MQFHEGAELVEALTELLAPWDAGVRSLLERAVEAEPARMRRVHDLVSLLHPDEAALRWLWGGGAAEAPGEAIARGAEGIREVDAGLVRAFERCAPRAVFPLGGRTEDPVRESGVLGRLIWERVREGRDLPLHHPAALRRQPLEGPDRRIASALLELLDRHDGPEARTLIGLALMDPGEPVRLAAVHAARGFVGHREVAQALQGARDDESDAVRAGALEGLGRFSRGRDMAARLAAFGFDPDWRTRLRVLDLLADAGHFETIAQRLWTRAFDPSPEVRDRARGLLDEESIREGVEAMARRAAAGEEMTPFELRALAVEPDVDHARRCAAFRDRIAALEPRTADLRAVCETLRAVGSFADAPDAALWAAVARIAAKTRAVPVERAVLPALRRHPGGGAFEAAEAILRCPADPAAASLRAGVAEAAAEAAAGNPEASRRLAVAAEEAPAGVAREAAVWGAARGCAPADFVRLAKVLMDEEDGLETYGDALARGLAGASGTAEGRRLLGEIAHRHPGRAGRQAENVLSVDGED